MLLEVAAAAVIVDGRLLMVSKTAAPAVFHLPGGKPDDDEAPGQTLVRELREELSTVPVDVRPYLVVEAPAALEGVPMRMTVFRCALAGTRRPGPGPRRSTAGRGTAGVAD